MSDFLWSEWRSEYIQHSEPSDGCFLCRAAEGGVTASSLVVYADDGTIVLLNRYPYNPGHLLVAPTRHVGSLLACSADSVAHLFMVVRHVVAIAEPLYKAHGWNIGINQGSVAGAGVPGHLHVHAVPRWEGDSNFMPVLADVRVVSQRLDQLWERLRDAMRANPMK